MILKTVECTRQVSNEAGLAHPLTDERLRDYLSATTSLGGSRINVDRYRRLAG